MPRASDVARKAARRVGELAGVRRYPLMALITPESLDGFERFAITQGVTVTGCLEALGRALGEAADGDPADSLAALAERAREFDRGRGA